MPTKQPKQATKQLDEMYCPSCGKIVKKDAVVCVHCGVQIGHYKSGPTTPRDKTAAVLLAVFLGLWTWIYTYKLDGWKFWLNLILTIVTFGIWGLAAWIWAIIDVCVKPPEYYTEYPNYQPTSGN